MKLRRQEKSHQQRAKEDCGHNADMPIETRAQRIEVRYQINGTDGVAIQFYRLGGDQVGVRESDLRYALDGQWKVATFPIANVFSEQIRIAVIDAGSDDIRFSG